MASSDWTEFLRTPSARLICLTAVVAVLCALGYYVVGKLRARLHESGPSASDFMTNFRELHARGELSDEEFRTIKAKLAAKLQEQVKREQAKQQKSEA